MNTETDLQSVDEALVRKARNDLVYSGQGSAIAIICAVILFYAWSIREDVYWVSLVAWTTVCLASYLYRLALYRSYNRASDDIKSRPYWELSFTLASAVSGIVWGASAFLIFPEHTPNYQMLMILLMVILCAATTVTHVAYRWASLAFTTTCLIPLMAKMFLLGGAGFNQLGLFLLFYWFVLASSAKLLVGISNRMFELNRENNRLIVDLKYSNSELKNKNVLLEKAKVELGVANDRLQKVATTDALTNLTNRRKFEALLKVKWRRCSDSKTPISLLLVNIDMFRSFNDFYGQRKGDACLAQIAELLSRIPEINRSSDSVARYSGDEFAILLVDADYAYASHVAEMLRSEIERLRIPRSEIPGEPMSWLSVSIGVNTEHEYVDSSSEEIIANADKSLQRAKRSGRNSIRHFDAVG